MKKYLLMACALILAACSDGSDTAKELQTKVKAGKSDYKLTYVYNRNEQNIGSDEITYNASEKSFDVKTTIKKNDDSIIVTYKTFEDGDKIEDLKAIDQNGNEYDVESDTYSELMKDSVVYEIDFLFDISNGIYENVAESETDATYDYTVTNTIQTDSYKLNKNGSGFTSRSKKSVEETLATFEFL